MGGETKPLADRGFHTRARILDEALRLASRDGLEGLSIGTLAAALELSKSGLFAHFGSKEALQVAVLEEAAARFRAQVIHPLAQLPEGPARPRAFLQGCMDWVDDPALPGGCPITGACFEYDDREGAPRQTLLSLQIQSQAGVRALFEPFATGDLDQHVFEFRAILLAYHVASRVLRDPQARARAEKALEALLERV